MREHERNSNHDFDFPKLLQCIGNDDTHNGRKMSS